jgi:hypothetical protein
MVEDLIKYGIAYKKVTTDKNGTVTEEWLCPLLLAEDFKTELDGKPLSWPTAWDEIAATANKLFKEKQCK